jgi:hypothetical protein
MNFLKVTITSSNINFQPQSIYIQPSKIVCIKSDMTDFEVLLDADYQRDLQTFLYKQSATITNIGTTIKEIEK